MTATDTKRRAAIEMLKVEECDVWLEYLAKTKDQVEPRYTEVESWAWAHLTQRLKVVKARRAKLAA